MLIEAGVLQQPLLYISLFFKQHRSRYYELLDRLRPQEDWEAMSTDIENCTTSDTEK